MDGTIGRTVQQTLQSPQMPPLPSLVTVLLNDVSASDTALTLELDDYQLIRAPAVHELVSFMLEYQPPLMHLVIGTREDPPLHLPLLRA